MKRNEAKDDCFDTEDLMEIAYLMLRRVPIAEVFQNSIGRVNFRFQGLGKCRELLLDLGCGRDTVSLSAAMATIKRARQIMHSI